jgi:hypothetical protein
MNTNDYGHYRHRPWRVKVMRFEPGKWCHGVCACNQQQCLMPHIHSYPDGRNITLVKAGDFIVQYNDGSFEALSETELNNRFDQELEPVGSPRVSYRAAELILAYGTACEAPSGETVEDAIAARVRLEQYIRELEGRE